MAFHSHSYNESHTLHHHAQTYNYPYPRPLPLIPSVIGSFRVVKRYLNPSDTLALRNKDKLNEVEKEETFNLIGKRYLTKGMDFSDDAKWAVIAAQDASISLIDCYTGTLRNTLYSKKYGVGTIKFSHDNTQIIYASEFSGSLSQEMVVRHLSLPDNTYIRYFKGHTAPIYDLQIHPFENSFLTVSQDGYGFLWDIRASEHQAYITVKGRSSLAYDPTGRVIAVADQFRPGITLYDIRKLSEGGFQHFSVPTLLSSNHAKNPLVQNWTGLKFTNDGQKLILSTMGEYHYVIDALDGHSVVPPLKRTLPKGGLGKVASYSILDHGQDVTVTPNGRFVMSGSLDGTVDVWDLEHHQKQHTDPEKIESNIKEMKPVTKDKILFSHNKTPISTLQFNPGLMMMVSGTYDLAFWQPNLLNLADSSHHKNATFKDYGISG